MQVLFCPSFLRALKQIGSVDRDDLLQVLARYPHTRAIVRLDHFDARFPSPYDVPSRVFLPIERTSHGQPSSIEHVGIDHRRTDLLVAQPFLHGADVVAGFQ